MKALTIQQPWAWAIINGRKKIENRSWVTTYRGTLLIHAGKGRNWLNNPIARDLCPDAPPENELIFGAIIGAAEIVDCVPIESVKHDPFASGPFCWMLSNAQRFQRPVSCVGKLGLWTPPSSISILASVTEAGAPTNR